MPSRFDDLADGVLKAVEGYVAAALKGVSARLDELAADIVALRVKEALPGPRGEPGPAGEKGVDGAAGATGEQGPAGPVGAPGEPGPAGERGERGADGKDGAPGRDGVDGKDGAPGINGKDGLPGAEGPRGAPGERGIDGRDGREGKDGANGINGNDGINGKDGKDGRDALHVDEFAAALQEDGRTLRLTLSSGGKEFNSEVVLAVPLDRGVWREGEYQRGDTVSFGGSAWIAQRTTTDKPETSDAWRLAVKRGRDGKDGKR